MHLSLVKSHPLFRRIPGELWQDATAAAHCKQVAKGCTIYDRHHFSRSLGVVLDGRVQVQKDQLLLSTLTAGDVFGAAALFSDKNDYPTTLTALTDCTLLLIPQEVIRLLLRKSPDFAEDYVQYLSGRIQFLSDRLDTLSAGTAEEKLGSYLLSAANSENTVTLSATQLSARIGVGRASLYRAFDSLEQAGIIAREGKTIRILSRETLHRLIERSSFV